MAKGSGNRYSTSIFTSWPGVISPGLWGKERGFAIMKRIVVVLAVMLLWSLPAMAETYTWTDKNGTVNFSDNYYSVPKQYRKKVHRLGDIDAPLPSVDAEKGGERLSSARGMDKSGDTGNGSYGGKKTGVWQEEFKVHYAEVRQLENELTELEGLIKKPVGISRERMDGLPQEFKATQKRYNDALKAYNDLNDTANKVGLPAEFRK
ncbi:DUF4124 domain-containing protein [Oryzomonas rubra]|uniref:DUF4124 domain-containing protein n=2 Tax=Oryzomonas rubra TaxID=2509454 RepID=A0A5A9X5R1_9BACT|nr:DUF4124 domain-containing protein [Oryzomonas rubra]